MMLFRAVKQTNAARLAELRRPGAAPEVQRALSAAAIAQELDSLTPVYPCLVAEIDGQVEACAFAAPLRPESAYQWDVELHIFVSEERRRQGVGSALLLRLMRVLSVQGFLQLCAEIGQAIHQFSGRLLRPDSSLRLLQDIAGIQPFSHEHGGHAGDLFPIDHTPLHRTSAPIPRKQRRMDIDTSIRRQLQNFLGQNPPISRHYDYIRF